MSVPVMIDQLGHYADDLREIFGQAGAASWMVLPNEQLGNRTPNQLIEEGRKEEVIRLIDQLSSGAYA